MTFVRRYGLRASRLLTLLVFVAWASPALSAPIAYDEATDPDLSRTGSPLTTFTLDVGTNTITGAEAFLTVDPFIDLDSFAFIVPAGLTVTSVTLSLTGGSNTFARWSLYSGSANSLSGTFLTNLGGIGGTTPVLSLVPLSAGTYNFSDPAIACGPCDEPQFFPYTFSFEVAAAPVPEPASLSLLGLSVAGLAARRWRQRRQN